MSDVDVSYKIGMSAEVVFILKANRVLVIGFKSDAMNKLTKRLEFDGYLVTGTFDSNVAADLAASSQFDALVIDNDIHLPNRGYLVSQAREQQPDIVIVVADGYNSVITQLSQAFNERSSASESSSHD